MKVYQRVKNTVYVLASNELFTVQMSDGKDFSDKEAQAIVRDLKELNPTNTYWAGERDEGEECANCGRGYGAHYDDECPTQDTLFVPKR